LQKFFELLSGPQEFNKMACSWDVSLYGMGRCHL